MKPVKPVEGTISSGYGVKRTLFGQTSVHRGIDIVSKEAKPVVKLAYDGTVVMSGFQKDFGNRVWIRRNNSVLHDVYAHLASINANATIGRAMKAGDEVGIMGTTGRSTGRHLHFETRKGGASPANESVEPTEIIKLYQ